MHIKILSFRNAISEFWLAKSISRNSTSNMFSRTQLPNRNATTKLKCTRCNFTVFVRSELNPHIHNHMIESIFCFRRRLAFATLTDWRSILLLRTWVGVWLILLRKVHISHQNLTCAVPHWWNDRLKRVSEEDMFKRSEHLQFWELVVPLNDADVHWILDGKEWKIRGWRIQHFGFRINQWSQTQKPFSQQSWKDKSMIMNP